jgi:hypothetical protein
MVDKCSSFQKCWLPASDGSVGVLVLIGRQSHHTTRRTSGQSALQPRPITSVTRSTHLPCSVLRVPASLQSALGPFQASGLQRRDRPHPSLDHLRLSLLRFVGQRDASAHCECGRFCSFRCPLLVILPLLVLLGCLHSSQALSAQRSALHTRPPLSYHASPRFSSPGAPRMRSIASGAAFFFS